jgi:hypothetical protein
VVALDLDVPRCHLMLGWFDVDSLLTRLEGLGEPIDMDAIVERLRDAAQWDAALMQWCRDVAQDAGV